MPWFVLVMFEVVTDSLCRFLLLTLDEDILEVPNNFECMLVTVPVFANRSDVAMIIFDTRLHDSMLD